MNQIALRSNTNAVARRGRPRRRTANTVRVRRRPRVTAAGSNTETMRTLRRITTLDMLDADGNDNFGSFNIVDSLTNYDGYENLANLFDQYQIRNCRVYISAMNSSPSNAMQILADIAATKVYSCLDYDTDASLSFDQIFSRKGTRVQSLPGSFLLVKSFVPKFLRSSPLITEHGSTLNPRVTWYNTTAPTAGHAKFNGLKMYVKNYGGEPAHDTAPTYQKFKMWIEIDVALRGSKLV